MARAIRHDRYAVRQGDSDPDCEGWIRTLYVRSGTRLVNVGSVCDGCGAAVLDVGALTKRSLDRGLPPVSRRT